MESFRSPSLESTHEPLGLVWSFPEPTGWTRTTDPASGLWGELFDEQAVVHGKSGSGFYMRGTIEIPVLDAARDLRLTVWVSLGGEDFARAHRLWEDPRRAEEPAYLGRLCNRIPGYPDTWHLATYVHTQPVGFRPVVELEPSDHPLVTDQKRGITVARVVELTSAFEASMEKTAH